MFQKTILKNGLRVITSEMPQMQSVASTIFIGAGSRYENKQNNGISHFLEHMLFKGSKKRPSQKEIAQVIEGVGGVLNGGTSIDWTCYWTLTPAKYFSVGLDVLSDMIFNSLFDSKEIKKEKGVIIEEINRKKDDPEIYIESLIQNLMWKGQSLGFTPLGTKENIKKTKKVDFLNYLKNLYQPSNMVISVAGNIKHEKVIKETERLLGNIKNGRIRKFKKIKEIQKKPRILLHKKETDQIHLCLGTKTEKLDHFTKSIFKTIFEILNTVLGRGMSSRLFLEIREKKGLAYSIGSSIDSFREVSSLVVSAGLNIDKIEEAIRIILKEFKKLKEKRVGERELKKAKEFIKGILLLRMENTNFVSSWYGLQELLSFKIQTPEEKIAEIKKITATDIKKAAEEIFRTQKLNLAMVGPFKEKDKERFLKLLKI